MNHGKHPLCLQYKNSSSVAFSNGATNELKKKGAGKANWGREGEEQIDELPFQLNVPFEDGHQNYPPKISSPKVQVTF